MWTHRDCSIFQDFPKILDHSLWIKKKTSCCLIKRVSGSRMCNKINFWFRRYGIWFSTNAMLSEWVIICFLDTMWIWWFLSLSILNMEMKRWLVKQYWTNNTGLFHFNCKIEVLILKNKRLTKFATIFKTNLNTSLVKI